MSLPQRCKTPGCHGLANDQLFVFGRPGQLTDRRVCTDPCSMRDPGYSCGWIPRSWTRRSIRERVATNCPSRRWRAWTSQQQADTDPQRILRLPDLRCRNNRALPRPRCPSRAANHPQIPLRRQEMKANPRSSAGSRPFHSVCLGPARRILPCKSALAEPTIPASTSTPRPPSIPPCCASRSNTALSETTSRGRPVWALPSARPSQTARSTSSGGAAATSS